MSHERSRDELVDLALGLLEPDAARALEDHAGTCATCRAELDALRRTRHLLAGLPPAEAPARGEAPLLAAAREAAARAGAERRPRWTPPRWLWGGTLGLAGAAALAVLVLRVSPAPPGGPLDEDREALLGRGAPAAAPASSAGSTSTAAEPRDAARDEKAVLVRKKAAEAPLRAEPPPGTPGPAQGRSLEAAPPAALPAAPAAPVRQAAPAMPPEPQARSGEAIGVRESKGEAPGLMAAPAPVAKALQQQPAAEAEPAAARAPARVAAVAASAPADAGGAPCRLEARRRLTRDAAGQVVSRLREGRYPADGGDVPLSVEERFGPDGRLLTATVRAGERRLAVSEADVEAGRLEPLPGVILAPTAAEAERAPPRCEP